LDRVLIEKLIITQLSKKFPATCGTRVHNSLPLFPIMSRMIPIHNFPFYFPKIHFNIILPSTPRSEKENTLQLISVQSITNYKEATYFLCILVNPPDKSSSH